MSKQLGHRAAEPPGWLESLRAGDEGAWRLFVERYSGRIYRYFYNAAPDGEDIEQLASQAVQGMYQQLAGFRGDASLLTWIYAICRNVLVDAHRKRGRWNYFVENYSPFSLIGRVPDPEAALLHKDQVATMHQALRTLPIKYKEVIALRYIEEHSIQEVAGLLGLAPDLVKNRARRGKHLLRKAMVEHGFSGVSSLAAREDNAI